MGDIKGLIPTSIFAKELRKKFGKLLKMTKLNTTKKGDIFENEVFIFFENEINANRFYAKKECCKIFAKKGYYSKDRLKDIIFDISIEIYLANQDKYSMLILIECKNYNHKVPVDDIEEFYQKVEQISGGNTKAIIVTPNAFQEGTFNFSQSKGIGLLRYRNQKDLDWILPRSPSSLVSYKYAQTQKDSVYTDLRSEKYTNSFFDCCTFFNYQYTNSFSLFISALLEYKMTESLKNSLLLVQTNFSGEENLVEHIDNMTMEQLTADILSEIDYKDGKVKLEEISTLLEQNHNLKIFYNQNLKQGILGEIDFVNHKICIDNKQCETPVRTRFTIAHEFAHYFLKHSRYMLGEKFYNKEENNLEKPFGIGIEDVVRMEWQANQFASYLLLPQKNFLKDFYFYVEKYEIKDKGFGLIYLDKQRCNREIFNKVSTPLMHKYKVSSSVIKIRLKKLNLLQE